MLTDLTLTQAQTKLRAGEITAVELTQAHLDRIQAVDPQVKAFLTITAERALEDAAKADLSRQQGADTPLLGIPLAIKDVLVTKGVQTTCGSQILKGFIPPYTGTAVQKLFDAGAILKPAE